jgi:hypothetical protein
VNRLSHARRDRQRRHLRLVANATPEPPSWTDRRVAELVELAWASGALYQCHGLPSWRHGVDFEGRVTRTAAMFARTRARHSPQRNRRQAGAGGAA